MVLLTDGRADAALAVVTRKPNRRRKADWGLVVLRQSRSSSSCAAEGELEARPITRPIKWQSYLAIGPAMNHLYAPKFIGRAMPATMPRGAHALEMLCLFAGESLEEKGRYHTAATWYARILEVVEPFSLGGEALGGPLCNLGLAKKRAGEVEEALALYDRAIELCPVATPLIDNRKTLVSQLKDWGIATAAAQ